MKYLIGFFAILVIIVAFQQWQITKLEKKVEEINAQMIVEVPWRVEDSSRGMAYGGLSKMSTKEAIEKIINHLEIEEPQDNSQFFWGTRVYRNEIGSGAKFSEKELRRRQGKRNIEIPTGEKNTWGDGSPVE